MKAMSRHRSHSVEFKRQVAQEFVAGETLHGLAKRHDISRNLIRVWVAKYELGAFDEARTTVWEVASNRQREQSWGHATQKPPVDRFEPRLAESRANPVSAFRKLGSHRTPRWRKPDSNPRSIQKTCPIAAKE
jgi:hypothetical protein